MKIEAAGKVTLNGYPDATDARNLAFAQGFELVEDLHHKAPGFGCFHKWRQSIEQERALSKLAQAHAQAREHG